MPCTNTHPTRPQSHTPQRRRGRTKTNFQMDANENKIQNSSAQNFIGWDHLLKDVSAIIGSMPTATYLACPDTDSTKQSGEQWLKRVLNCIWTSLWQVWLIRNDDLHGRDRQQRRKRSKKLKPKSRPYTQSRSTPPAADGDIFAIPLPDSLSQVELSTWVKRDTDSTASHLRTQMNIYTNNNTTILHTRTPDPIQCDQRTE
jgi:hypothetical protein